MSDKTDDLVITLDQLGEWLTGIDEQLCVLAATAFEAQALARSGGDAKAALEYMEARAEATLYLDDGTPISDDVPAARGQRHAIQAVRQLADEQDQQAN